MDTTVLILFLAATFIGGVINGLAGFAFGLFVSGIWLHILTPLQTATMIVVFGLLTQSYGAFNLRHVFRWRHVIPLSIGGLIGTPIGVWLLAYMNPDYMRLGVGVLLIVYSLYGFFRPALKPLPANVPWELVLGALNGMLGGMTGLTGPVVTVWCGLRGWSKDEQRSVYQPVILAAFLVAAVSLTFSGAYTVEVGTLFLYGVPVLLAGLWIGTRLYGYLDDATFRKIVLGLLLVSGIALVMPFH